MSLSPRNIYQGNFFFNQEDVQKIFYKSYVDSSEEEIKKYIEEKESLIKYPKFKID